VSVDVVFVDVVSVDVVSVDVVVVVGGDGVVLVVAPVVAALGVVEVDVLEGGTTGVDVVVVLGEGVDDVPVAVADVLPELGAFATRPLD
jgi:hypothetical protein